MVRKTLHLIAFAGIALSVSASEVFAGPLLDRIAAGQPVRLGFATTPPAAFPGPDGKPEGFLNAYVIAVLKKMDAKINIEASVGDFGSLIPALQAGRTDVVTGGLYIKARRCENIAFAEPVGKSSDVLLVPKGNPKGLENYVDVAKKVALLGEGVGYAEIEAAKRFGVLESQIVLFPGITELAAAVRAGRVDAVSAEFFTAQRVAERSNGALTITDPSKMPEESIQWFGIGFRKEDADFLKLFDAAQSAFLGSPEMMKVVAPFGYTAANLPGNATLGWICEHR